ncbi:site-specific DNA-methyltransferase [Candidatus Methanarcanum hacksteinii]|uniref:site-specific DNA-methyltransferase n=1 Tax=Candidatus Methanarcanum hacksteinii TaxID=2911857 RepID=UPI0037DCFDCF
MTERLEMCTKDLSQEKIRLLGELFPNCITESKENEKVVRSVDFDALRQELSDHVVEGPKERYQFTWPDKNKARVLANAPTTMTLRPCREESVDFDTTKNLYIEGDNLEVLKILRETYLGKIKMIYIDPPYNTGNDFVYDDDYSMSAEEYSQKSGDISDSGERLVLNTSSNGRFHTDWLNMIYPRLVLARDLLCDDGAIFLSIDDCEECNLKKICDEIFGESNHINSISVKMSELSGVKMKHLNKYAKLKETLYIYAKNANKIQLTIEKKHKDPESLEKYLKYYSNIITNIDDPCEKWVIKPLNQYFKELGISIQNNEINNWKLENANKLIYRTNSKTIDNYIKYGGDSKGICKIINGDGNEIIKWDDKEMLFLSKYVDEYIGDIWTDVSTINLNKETESVVFENGQKPVFMLKRIIKSLNLRNEIILDFFAGSSSTAYATILQNLEDSGNRQYIMVQIPEDLDKKMINTSGTTKQTINEIIDFLDSISRPHVLTEIGKERIRRLGKKIQNQRNDIDIGFRVYKLDSSNMTDVFFNPESFKQMNVEEFGNNVKPDRSSEDLLTQAMLELGIELSAKIETKSIENTPVSIVDDGYLVACLSDLCSESTITALAKREIKPTYAVIRNGPGMTDQMLSNIEQIFKTYSPGTEVRLI